MWSNIRNNTKRNIVIGSLLLLAVIGIVVYKSGEEPQALDEYPITMEKTSNAFYYNQLTTEEKNVYELIIEEGKDYHGGKLVLEDGISIDSYNRIITTLFYDEEYSDCFFAGAYPFDGEGKLITAESNHEEKIIQSLYVQMFDFQPENSGADTFVFEVDSEGVLLNEEQLLEVLQNNTLDANICQAMTDEMTELENEIVAQMPENLSQKEAVLFFSDWIKDNMKYDTELMEYYGTLEYEEPSARLRYAEVSNELCILKKNAFCGGLSMLLARLCNKVGISSYVVNGEIYNNGNGGAHGWAAVQIGEETYYYDPTYACVTNRQDTLTSKSRMEAERYDGRRYVFSELFRY